MTALLVPPASVRSAEPAIPGITEVFVLISIMLGYPDEELCESREAIKQALTVIPPSSAQRECLEFATWWVAVDPARLREDYVATFDTRRRSALYVTYNAYRDTDQRGVALYDMKQLYRSYGFRPTDEELPDYLPTVCQFAALAPTDGGLEALRLSRVGVHGIRQALIKQKSVYAHLLTAIEYIIEKGVKL